MDRMFMKAGGDIHIQPKNVGKFTAYKQRTGKTTAEAKNSSDPNVRKMAVFADNAKKWQRKNGGVLYKKYQNGGPVNTDGPTNTLKPVMTDGQMRARMATAAELGNKSAQRMLSLFPKTYTFGIDANGNKIYGTHFMSSVDNYAVPLLQDKGGEELEFVNDSKPSKEDIELNSEEEAKYFAENYKKVAPMNTGSYDRHRKAVGVILRKFQQGGTFFYPQNPGYEYRKSGNTYEKRKVGDKNFYPVKEASNTQLEKYYRTRIATNINDKNKPAIADNTAVNNTVAQANEKKEAGIQSNTRKDLHAAYQNGVVTDKKYKDLLYKINNPTAGAVDRDTRIAVGLAKDTPIVRRISEETAALNKKEYERMVAESSKLRSVILNPVTAAEHWVKTGKSLPAEYEYSMRTGLRTTDYTPSMFARVADSFSPLRGLQDAQYAVDKGNYGEAAVEAMFSVPFMGPLKMLSKTVRGLSKITSRAGLHNTTTRLLGTADNMVKAPIPRVTDIVYQSAKAANMPEPFKSEINWGAWNKEIPENRALMQEYYAIEQQAKANGTWMKNADGSEFVGTKPTQKDIIDNPMMSNDMTPEEAIKAQFVQQNSKNFKKYYHGSLVGRQTNGEPIYMYHGSPNKNINTFLLPGDMGYIKSPTTTTGKSGIYFTDLKSYANKYQNFADTKNLNGRTYQVYLAPKTAFKAGESGSSGLLDGTLGPSFLWNHGPVLVDAILSGAAMQKIYPKHGFEVSMENKSLIKSAMGNNGKFDTTKSNIYKVLFPVALGSSLLYNKKKNEKTF